MHILDQVLWGNNQGGQNPRALDDVEITLHEVNTAGEFLDPWGTRYPLMRDGKICVYS